MAGGALIVPGLVASGPVQSVAGMKLLSRIQVEPALAALFLWPRIPGDAERLQASSRQADQVLLQRIDAECVGHIVVVRLTVGSLGPHREPPIGTGECRGHAIL